MPELEIVTVVALIWVHIYFLAFFTLPGCKKETFFAWTPLTPFLYLFLSAFGIRFCPSLCS